MDFHSLALSPPILKAVIQQGYEKPSPIQQQAIPAILKGKDVMAAAQTGTGKTAGFTLPILENLLKGKPAQSNHVRALILTPTRELAAQVHDNVVKYGEYVSLKSAVVFGGVKINPQMMKLRRGVDILVATPGRLLDIYSQNAIKFQQLEVLVLDEADRMLDMGFIHDIRKIIELLPKNRQNLMFSATFSNDIRRLAKSLIKDPIEISVSPANTTVDAIKQCMHPVDKKKKSALLAHLIKKHEWSQVLVFTKTKHGANRLTKFLMAKDISAVPIHGNKSQGARTKALAAFKNNEIKVLVATDIAARGIDIQLLPHVVNFDLPHVSEDYVHRIGRTGRAGSKGEAVSLVSADEIKLLKGIERLIKQILPRKFVDGFEPEHDVPVSVLDTRPIKPKKPKKPKNNNKQAPEKNKKDSQKPTRKGGNRKKPISNSARKKTPYGKKRSASTASKPQKQHKK